MLSKPRCPHSQSVAVSFCSIEGCKHPAFFCGDCPRQSCLASHMHTTDHIKNWENSYEKIFALINSPPKPPGIESMKGFKSTLEDLANQIMGLIKIYTQHMSSFVDGSHARQEILTALTNLRTQNYGAVTGDDMYKLAKVAAGAEGHSYYSDEAALSKKLKEENARMEQAIKIIQEGINFYKDPKARSILRSTVAALSPEKKPQGCSVLETAKKLNEKDKYAEAKVLLKELLAKEQNNVEGWLLLYHAHMGLEELEDAVGCCDRGIAIQPDNHKIYFMRGVCHYRTKMHKRNIADCLKAIELAGNNSAPEYYFMLASSYCKISQHDKALEPINKAIALKRDNVQFLARRAQIYEKLGKQQETMQDKTQILMLNSMRK